MANDSPPPINDLINELKHLVTKVEASGFPQAVAANVNQEIAVIRAKISALLDYVKAF